MFTLSALWMEHLNSGSENAGGGTQLKARKDPNRKVLRKKNVITLHDDELDELVIFKILLVFKVNFYFLACWRKFL